MQIIGYRLIEKVITDQIVFYCLLNGLYHCMTVQTSTSAQNMLNHIPKMTEEEFKTLLINN
jgi:hypothetical protein